MFDKLKENVASKIATVKKWVRRVKITAIALVVIVPIAMAAPHFIQRETITIDIIKTERVTDKATGKSTYVIFTEKEQFTNSDSWLEGKWDAADDYAHLNAGKKATVTVYGIRWGFMSWYRNIASVDTRVKTVDTPEVPKG